MTIRESVNRVSDLVNSLMEKLLLMAGSAISIILFIQVVARYTGSSLSWSEEVGRHLLVAITFLGGTVAYKRASFIGLKGFAARLGPTLQQAIVRLLQLLTLGCFMIIAWFGAAYTVTAWEQTSFSLQIPMAIPIATIPLSAAVFLVHVAADICKKNGDAEKGEEEKIILPEEYEVFGHGPARHPAETRASEGTQ